MSPPRSQGPRSHGIVRRLSVVPVWVLFLAVLALTVGGFLSDGVLSFVLLACVVALMAVLASVQWSALVPNQRVVRTIAIVALGGVAVYRLVSS